MAEEVIRVKEETETASEPVKEAESMGTVISMESVKPAAAESYVQQQGVEAAKAPKAVQEEFSRQQTLEGEPKRIEDEAGEPVFYGSSAAEQKESASSGRDREKKRINDFFHLRKDIDDFTREDWILSRIPEEDLMGYLTMEQQKSEMLQKAKELKEKRIFTTLQIVISMSAIVAVVALLRDNPTVLVNILYITGIVIALWIWRGKQDK